MEVFQAQSAGVVLLLKQITKLSLESHSMTNAPRLFRHYATELGFRISRGGASNFYVPQGTTRITFYHCWLLGFAQQLEKAQGVVISIYIVLLSPV